MGTNFKLLSSETLDLTPKLAAEFQAMSASMTERDSRRSAWHI